MSSAFTSAWMESEKLLSSGFLDENDMEDTTYISHSHIYVTVKIAVGGISVSKFQKSKISFNCKKCSKRFV